MEKKNNKLPVILFLIVVIVIFMIIMSIFVRSRNKDLADNILKDDKILYDYNSSHALEKLKSENGKASIIDRFQSDDNIIALTFDGMTDTEDMIKIKDILNKYNVEASFFIEGIRAAEDADTVGEIFKDGYDIENYTLSGKKHLEKLNQNEQVKNFDKSQFVLSKVVGEEPEILKCNVTNYNNEILESAHAAGIKYMIKPEHMLSASSFKSYEEAFGYISKLKSGDIISFKLNEELDEEEYLSYNQNDKPAEDLKPGLDDTDDKKEKKDVVKTVEYLVQAISDRGYKTISARDVTNYIDNADSEEYHDVNEVVNGNLAPVFTQIPNSKNMINLSFKGIKNEVNLDKILNVLHHNNIKTTFYVTESDIKNYPNRIKEIQKAGHEIHISEEDELISSKKRLSTICEDIKDDIDSLREELDIESSYYMPFRGKYEFITRGAAEAAKTTIISFNKNPIIDKSRSVDEIMDSFNSKLRNGDILYFDLDFHTEVSEVVERIIDRVNSQGLLIGTVSNMMDNYVKPIYNSNSTYSYNQNIYNNQDNNSQNNNQDMDSSQDSTIGKEELINEDKIKKYLSDKRAVNNGKIVDAKKNLFMVEDSVAFTFYDINDEVCLKDVLYRLNKMNGKGTFFVSEREIRRYPDRINEIIRSGNEVGIAIETSSIDTFDTIGLKIYNTHTMLRDKFGVNTSLVFAPFKEKTEIVQEVVSSLNYTLVGYDSAIVHGRDKEATDAKAVVNSLFSKYMYALRQGEIVYFRMSYYSDSTLLGKVLQEVKEQKIDSIIYKSNLYPSTVSNRYEITSVGNLLNNNDSMYSYPLEASSILPDVKDKIYSNHIKIDDTIDLIYNRLIGNISARTTDELAGFSEEEVKNIDKTGKIKTNDPVIFLTFDDWGSDVSVNKILSVLKKHNVRATFFIRTNNVKHNPNLLRKIALDGHKICSHTDTHMMLSNPTDKDGVFSQLTDNQLELLRQDVITSYYELQKIIGDVAVNGEPALTTWFRPPTLAVSRKALDVMLDTGFSYIIGGNISTHDYEANSIDDIYNVISNDLVNDSGSLEKGSIVVMHMSDDSKYTAEAVDKLLTENEKKSDDDPTKFIVGDLSDYLNKDYKQVDIK